MYKILDIENILEELKSNDADVLIPVGVSEKNEVLSKSLNDFHTCLITGDAGSGKSILLHNMLVSLTNRYKPNELRLILWDSKGLEFYRYRNSKNLLYPIIDNDELEERLRVTVDDMMVRLQLMEEEGVKNFKELNEKFARENLPTLPYFIVVIDEIYDLVYSKNPKLLQYLGVLCQKAKAAGIHLLMTSQMESNDKILSKICANYGLVLNCYYKDGFKTKLVESKKDPQEIKTFSLNKEKLKDLIR